MPNVPDVPKHIADSSPITTPADRRDSAGRAPVDGPADAADAATPADATPGVAIAPPTARTVVIRPLLVPH